MKGTAPLLSLPALFLVASLALASGTRPATHAAPAAAERSTALLSGAGQSFLVTAPSGWILDNQAGRANGLHAVFYPVGSSWKRAPAVMYAVGVGTKDGEDETLDALIEGNLEARRQQAPELKVEKTSDLETADGKRATVRVLTGDPKGSREAVAFIREPRTIVLLVLTSVDGGSFDRSRAAFESLVASYRAPEDEEVAPR